MKNKIIDKLFIVSQVMLLSLFFSGLSFADGDISNFSLSDDGGVKASYDESEKLITVSGSGTIQEAKWIDFARMVEDGNTSYTVFKKAEDKPPLNWGWQIDDATNMVFVSGSTIQFSKEGFKGQKYGWFQDFPGTITLHDAIDTSNLTDMSHMFQRAVKFNDPSIIKWNTSSVTDMSYMFNEAYIFNQDIGYDEEHDYWNTFHLIRAKSMFQTTLLFNGDISSWDVTSLESMNAMFFDARRFNINLNDWKVDNVTDMTQTFMSAAKFNHPLDKWNTSKVTSMLGMFYAAKDFDQDVSTFDTNSVTDMRSMFYKSGIKRIDFLNRQNASTMNYCKDLLNYTAPDFVKFSKLKSFVWTLPENSVYWVRVNDGEPSKEVIVWTADNPSYTFNDNTKYEVDVKELPYARVDDFYKKYDGVEVTIDDIEKTQPDGIEGSWTLDYYGEIKKPGVYKALCTFTPTDNTYGTTRVDVTITIDKLDPVFSLPTDLSATYGDKVSTLTLPSYDNGSLKFVDENQAVGNAGNNDVPVIFIPNDKDLYKSVNKDVSVLVKKQLLLLKALSVEDKDYDGSREAEVDYSLSGRIDGDTNDEVYIDKLIALFSDENVGEDKEVSVNATLKGDKSENYRLQLPTGLTASIKKAIYNYKVPTGLKAWAGSLLSELRLPIVEGGSWAFKNGDTVLNSEGEYEYEIVFTPTSPNYLVSEVKAKVQVLPYVEEDEKEKEDEKEEEEKSDNGVGKQDDEDEDVIEELEGDEIFSPESDVDEIPFVDVFRDDWFYEYVKSVYKKNILTGTSADKFSPFLNVSRGMMIRSIYNMSEDKEYSAKNVFPDVRADRYYAAAVDWGYEKKIVKGYNGLYEPERTILRQEIIAMLYRYFKDEIEEDYSESSLLSDYADGMETSVYAREAMKWALSNKIIVGREDGLIHPKDKLTRAELAAIFDRITKGE